MSSTSDGSVACIAGRNSAWPPASTMTQPNRLQPAGAPRASQPPPPRAASPRARDRPRSSCAAVAPVGPAPGGERHRRASSRPATRRDSPPPCRTRPPPIQLSTTMNSWSPIAEVASPPQSSASAGTPSGRRIGGRQGASAFARRPLLHRDARHLEAVRRARVPAGAVHAPDQVQLRRVDIAALGVQHRLVVRRASRARGRAPARGRCPARAW